MSVVKHGLYILHSRFGTRVQGLTVYTHASFEVVFPNKIKLVDSKGINNEGNYKRVLLSLNGLRIWSTHFFWQRIFLN